MKKIVFMMTFCILIFASFTTHAQMITRTDAIWARTTTSAIALDGNLNETAWASAESVHVVYGISSGMPGGGWFKENGLVSPTDSMRATVKFLVKADSLYVGIRVSDKSVGGGLFNQFDGILSNIRRKNDPNRPVQDGEIFYAWCSESWADTQCTWPGAMPAFLGGLAGGDPYQPRSDSLRNIWDAATTVQGTQNNDADVDQGYTMELKINLAARGYTVSQPAGDIVMYSLSIYDADYEWPLDTLRQSGNRTWLQCPWGNANAYSHIRIYARPDVGLTGPVPTIGPEITIPGAGNYAAPVIDGNLTEPVWSNANVGTLQIQYGNAGIRNAYPSTAPYRSGQFQPNVNGGLAAVVDPNLATVKFFYKDDALYLGFDINDFVVQAVDAYDRWDGIRVILCARDALNGDNVLWPHLLTFKVDGSGTSILTSRQDDLAPLPGKWDSAGTKVQVALALKASSTIDTVGATPDAGYTGEIKVNLTDLGYPAGRGDGVVFMGIMLMDGDSFGADATSSYGTRTWFMREGDFNDGAAWCWMNPGVTLSVDGKSTGTPAEFKLLGNYPNPFNPTTSIKFTMPQSSDVTLEVFDVLGRLVAKQSLGVRQVGEQTATFNAANFATGMYTYRLTMNSTNAMLVGRMMLLK